MVKPLFLLELSLGLIIFVAYLKRLFATLQLELMPFMVIKNNEPEKKFF